MNKDINSSSIPENFSIKQAMEIINQNGLRIVFVIDATKKLLGVVTDGDIRGALLAGRDFETKVKEIMIREII